MGEGELNFEWAKAFIEELIAHGIDSVSITPGSRSTPLTTVFALQSEVPVYSHLDERAAAFFALGRARVSGQPAVLVCTSGTAGANYHPAVLEANYGRVPLIALTADRPPELIDSGANQTIDQRDLFGGDVRWSLTLPEPSRDDRRIDMVRTVAARSVAEAVDPPAGPVHLNFPFRKPLEPTDSETVEPYRISSRSDPSVRVSDWSNVPTNESAAALVDAFETAKRPLLVVGPQCPSERTTSEIFELARVTETPILADPLSGLRFDVENEGAHVFGGYDAYLDANYPSPDVVLYIGAVPTSKRLTEYLANSNARTIRVDPGGAFRDDQFMTTDVIRADPAACCASVIRGIDGELSSSSNRWLDRFERSEDRHWRNVESALTETALSDRPFEGAILAETFERAPEGSTVFVSNSMPIRDADRFGRPQASDLTVIGNRGVSGIDGIVSTGLGCASNSSGETIIVTGDLALYHDLNGLVAIDRCDLEVTIVLIHNDGGGIFHKLPIERFNPPFRTHFKTPHGLSFDGAMETFGLEYESVAPHRYGATLRDSIDTTGSRLLTVRFDAQSSHDRRTDFGPT